MHKNQYTSIYKSTNYQMGWLEIFKDILITLKYIFLIKEQKQNCITPPPHTLESAMKQ